MRRDEEIQPALDRWVNAVNNAFDILPDNIQGQILEAMRIGAKMNLYRITGILVVVKEGTQQTITVDIQASGKTGADAANVYTSHLGNYDRVWWQAGPFAELIESEETNESKST